MNIQYSIDGNFTTGLFTRTLTKHKKLQLLELEEVEKKDIQKKFFNQSDLVFDVCPVLPLKKQFRCVKNNYKNHSASTVEFILIVFCNQIFQPPE